MSALLWGIGIAVVIAFVLLILFPNLTNSLFNSIESGRNLFGIILTILLMLYFLQSGIWVLFWLGVLIGVFAIWFILFEYHSSPVR